MLLVAVVAAALGALRNPASSWRSLHQSAVRAEVAALKHHHTHSKNNF